MKYIRFGKTQFKFIEEYIKDVKYKSLGKLNDIKDLRWNMELRDKISLQHYSIELL